MLIGNRYVENKVYQGIEHFNHVPLTSSDIHEYADTSYMRSAHVLNSLVGSGNLNEPNCSISAQGISISEASTLLVDGDIVVVNSDEGIHMFKIADIAEAGYYHGIACVIGGYTQLGYNSILHNYGGLDNSEIPNDIVDPDLGIQVSKRYQFTWTTILFDYDDYTSNSVLEVDSLSEKLSTLLNTDSFTASTLSGSMRKFPAPAGNMLATKDTIYIIPILEYHYLTQILDAKSYKKLSVASESIVKKFTSVATADDPVASEITIHMDFDTMLSTDDITVTYQGIALNSSDYSINYTTHNITLHEFKREAGEVLVVTLRR